MNVPDSGLNTPKAYSPAALSTRQKDYLQSKQVAVLPQNHWMLRAPRQKPRSRKSQPALPTENPTPAQAYAPQLKARLKTLFSQDDLSEFKAELKQRNQSDHFLKNPVLLIDGDGFRVALFGDEQDEPCAVMMNELFFDSCHARNGKLFFDSFARQNSELSSHRKAQNETQYSEQKSAPQKRKQADRSLDSHHLTFFSDLLKQPFLSEEGQFKKHSKNFNFITRPLLSREEKNQFKGENGNFKFPAPSASDSLIFASKF